MQIDFERIDAALANHSRWIKMLQSGKVTLDNVYQLMMSVALAMPTDSLESASLRLGADVMNQVIQADQGRQTGKAGEAVIEGVA